MLTELESRGLVREATHHGRDLVDWVMAVFQGDEDKAGMTIKPAMRWDALVWLADRGYGRPVQSVNVSGADGGPVRVLDLTLLAAADLDQLEAVLSRGVREAAIVEPSAGEQSSGGQGSASAGPDGEAIDGQYRPVDDTAE